MPYEYEGNSMTKDSGVMVVAGCEDDFSLTGLTTEMLGLARRLSDELGGPVSAHIRKKFAVTELTFVLARC